MESGKFAKRPNENVWYGPEKTVERHLKCTGSDFPEAFGIVSAPFHCTPANSLVLSGTGFPSDGEIGEASKITRLV